MSCNEMTLVTTHADATYDTRGALWHVQCEVLKSLAMQSNCLWDAVHPASIMLMLVTGALKTPQICHLNGSHGSPAPLPSDDQVVAPGLEQACSQAICDLTQISDSELD